LRRHYSPEPAGPDPGLGGSGPGTVLRRRDRGDVGFPEGVRGNTGAATGSPPGLGKKMTPPREDGFPGGECFIEPENNMDHHEQPHQHHEKEREKRIAHEKERERREERLPSQIPPAWFVAVGVVLIGLVVLLWTLVF